MSRIRPKSELIRKFILDNVEKHPSEIARIAAKKFDISRQAINKHLKRLVDEESLAVQGKTKSRVYRLQPLTVWSATYELDSQLAEDVIWRNDVRQQLGEMPENIRDIWHYGFTEMFNNAIDHSEGSVIALQFSRSAVNTQLALYDDGIGIFKKIQQALGLLDERHAVLELAKGKLTTDPDRHTGEGIFFTSRMFDDFQILSGGTYYSHKYGDLEDWILERDKFSTGTSVWMKLDNHTARDSKKVFDQFTSSEDFGFNKTVVPVKLAQYGDDKLVSRSQAKRLIARFEKFQIVILDFKGVESIGQAFSDEIYRVFTSQFPDIELLEINANQSVKNMISRAKAN